MDNDHSCWVCASRQMGGVTLLGNCLWFETKGQPKKAIPPEVVDVGCKFWTKREKAAPVEDVDGDTDGH